MRVLVSILAFSAALATGAAYAQALPAGQAPAPRPTAPAQTPPAAPKPTPAPGQVGAPKPAPAPQELKPRFQDGMKYAYVNVQQVAAMSSEGKAAAERSR